MQSGLDYMIEFCTFLKISAIIFSDTFAYYSYMVDFIIVRSHLYEILEDRVWMKSYTFRTEMLKFLRYIDEKSKENVTVNTLRKLVSAGLFALLDYLYHQTKLCHQARRKAERN